MRYGISADVTSLDEDLRQLRNSKFSNEAIEEIKNWIFQSILQEEVNSETTLLEALKDGTVLCKLSNVLYKADNSEVSMFIKWKESKMPFVQMEQISQFLAFSRAYGVPEDELFQTVDLFGDKDSAIVYQNLKSLSRYANKNHPDLFPVIGPQLATKKPCPPVKGKPEHLQSSSSWS